MRSQVFAARPSIASGSRLLLALLACLVLAGTDAEAVIIASPDGTVNTSLPTVSGWAYVGAVNSASGTYLGHGWVITADHVGSGDFTLDGVVYPLVPGSEEGFDNEGGPGTPDLLMFRVSPYPPLPPLPLRSTPPVLNEIVLMMGCGRDRGDPTTYDPNGPLPPDPLDGWEWLGTSTKRWGSNEIDSFPPGLVLGTVSLATVFDEDEHPFEAQGSDGDSGGAVLKVLGGEELVGIQFAIGPANGQPGNTSLFTNATFAARIDFYYDQIQEIMAVPEPSAGTLPMGAMLLGLLHRHRRGPRRRR